MHFPVYVAILGLLAVQVPTPDPVEASHPSVVLLTQAARDSMNVVFRHFNQHWDELADLTTLERMLGTIRPPQLEYSAEGRVFVVLRLQYHSVACSILPFQR